MSRALQFAGRYAQPHIAVRHLPRRSALSERRDCLADVLEHLGYELDFPEDQTFNSGYHAEARNVVRHFLGVFEKCEQIVVPSGSCASIALGHFPDVFEREPETLARVQSLQTRMWEFATFLAEVAGVEDVGAAPRGGGHLPRQLPRFARDEDQRGELQPAEECCGFGGTFAVKFGELSGAMARTKAEAVIRTGATAVVGLDVSCLMQIRGALSRLGSNVRALHLAEVLASR